MAHKQANTTRRSEFQRMSKDELLRIIARYHFEYVLDDDSSRVVPVTDRWAHLSKTELLDLAMQCQ